MAVAAYLTGSTGSTLCAFTLLHSRTVYVRAVQSYLAIHTGLPGSCGLHGQQVHDAAFAFIRIFIRSTSASLIRKIGHFYT